jgi:hypothetical protein
VAPLPWLPASLAKQTEEWGWTNTVSSALGSLREQGEQIMQPIGQQISSAMPQPAPFQMPEVKLPEIRPFELPSMESWGFGQPAPAQPQPQAAQGFTLGPEAQQSATVTRKPPGASTGGFSLPGPEAWGMTGSAPSPTSTVRAPSSAGPGTAAPAGEIDNSSRAAFVKTAFPHMLAAAGGNRDAAEMMLAAAISENGSIGTGKPFWANNFFGIKGKGDAGSVSAATHEIVNGARQNISDAFAAYSSPTAGFAAFFDFLKTNSRYGPAMQRFQQSGDAAQLFRDVNAAGYATDPQWAQKVENIRAGQVAPVTKDLQAAPTPGEPGGAPTTRGSVWEPGSSAAPKFGTYTAESLTPNQFTEGQAQGLTAGEALAVCGPAAAVAFARANGRNPTLREAKELAQNLGLWDEGAGMHGPATQVQLLQKLGVESRMEQGTDWTKVAQEVQAGRPVIVDTPQHYFTVTGYDPQSGAFEFGQSAGVLKASKGRTRYRPDELPGLGMGAPRATIYLGGAR